MRLLSRPLLFVLCTTIVAASLQASGVVWPAGRMSAAGADAAASGSRSPDVPVPGGTAAVARALGLDAVPDRARFVAELTRLLEEVRQHRRTSIAALLEPLRLQPATESVPLPLTPAVWSDAIFHRRVAAADLLVSILSDRQASLICRALAALDDETLAYFESHASVLAALYEHASAAFGAFGANLHIRANRVVPPGGDRAGPLWEAVVGESTAKPDRFVTTLFGLGEGRTAYLYDTVAVLDSPRAAFALGLWIQDPALRLERMIALANWWTMSLREWRVRTQPFVRQANDAATVLMRIHVDPTGVPTIPATRGFWSRVFESDDQATKGDDRPIDAAWLLETVGFANARRRADHLDQIAFAQRAFAPLPPSDVPDALASLRALPRYRALMWTLERMGLKQPALYASAARQAGRISSLDATRGFPAVAQFQGALALVQRMAMVGTLDRGKTEALVAELLSIPLGHDGRYGGAVANWLRQKLLPAIPPADTVDTAFIAALAGPEAGVSAPKIRWEGDEYRFDPAASERRRLHDVREKQDGPSMSAAIELDEIARMLTTPQLRLEDARRAIVRLESVVDGLPAGRSDDAEALRSGVDPRPDVRNAVGRAVDELDKAAAARDLKRIARVGAALVELTDETTAQALMSLAYALEIGDPDGAALLSGDVSRRHDFGFGVSDSEMRMRARWSSPRQQVAPGAAWHVGGSLLGLDVALAGLALRRLRTDRALEAPTLISSEREIFAAGVALMNPFALEDRSRDAIADAIDAGRRRVRALAIEPATFGGIAEQIGMDGWRRRAVAWTLAHEPGQLESLFSLGELMALGRAATAELGAWGTAATVSAGCLCTEMPEVGGWSKFIGRSQPGLLAVTIPDLHLHIAVALKELGLPAGLAKAVLRAAVQDFVDEVRPTDADDWLTLVRGARSFTRERIQDYVAAAAADGPLIFSDNR